MPLPTVQSLIELEIRRDIFPFVQGVEDPVALPSDVPVDVLPEEQPHRPLAPIRPAFTAHDVHEQLHRSRRVALLVTRESTELGDTVRAELVVVGYVLVYRQRLAECACAERAWDDDCHADVELSEF